MKTSTGQAAHLHPGQSVARHGCMLAGVLLPELVLLSTSLNAVRLLSLPLSLSLSTTAGCDVERTCPAMRVLLPI